MDKDQDALHLQRLVENIDRPEPDIENIEDGNCLILCFVCAAWAQSLQEQPAPWKPLLIVCNTCIHELKDASAILGYRVYRVGQLVHWAAPTIHNSMIYPEYCTIRQSEEAAMRLQQIDANNICGPLVRELGFGFCRGEQEVKHLKGVSLWTFRYDQLQMIYGCR